MNGKTKMITDIREFLSYGQVKDRIVYRLINTERNKELLADVPHMEFMDLSIIFKCRISQNETNMASLLVHNAHAKLWGVSVETLYQDAKENTQKLEGYRIKDMAGVMHDMMSRIPEEFACDSNIADSLGGISLYVLTNKSGMEGSSCMLYSDVLRDFSDAVGSSFYIIPSSIHELLILPVWDVENGREISDMIREVNDTQVQQDEILSYSLYCYNMEDGQIRIC